MSIIAPRTMSDLERSLCTSSSFMREVRAAGLTGVIDGGGGDEADLSRFFRQSAGQQQVPTEVGGAAAGVSGDEDPHQLLVDPVPFLIGDNPEKDLPIVNVSSMIKSFDWDSFNGAFSLPEVAEATDVGSVPDFAAASFMAASGSSWAQFCKEVNTRVSAGDLGEHLM